MVAVVVGVPAGWRRVVMVVAGCWLCPAAGRGEIEKIEKQTKKEAREETDLLSQQQRSSFSAMFCVTRATSLLPSGKSSLLNVFRRSFTGEVAKQPFGVTPSGEEVHSFTLTNVDGMTAKLLSYGATLSELHVKDCDGKFDDVVLGYDTLDVLYIYL